MYPAAVFLRTALPPISLRHLRFLDIIFAPVNKVSDDDAAYLDWIQTIRWASDKLYLPRLTLRVEIADYYGMALIPESRRTWSKEFRREICLSYWRLMLPLAVLGPPGRRCKSHALAALSGSHEAGDEGGADRNESQGRGLYRFYVHMASPSTSLLFAGSLEQRTRDKKRWTAWGLDKRVERHVMGDEYDGEKVGKWSVKVGEWMWVIWYRQLAGEPSAARVSLLPVWEMGSTVSYVKTMIIDRNVFHLMHEVCTYLGSSPCHNILATSSLIYPSKDISLMLNKQLCVEMLPRYL